LTDPSGLFAQPIAAIEPRKMLRTLLPWIAAAIVLGAVIAGLAVWKLKPTPTPEARQVMRFEYQLPSDQQFNISTTAGHTLAISSDGSQFVYSTSKGLYLRSVNEAGAKLVIGTEGNPQSPFFSPDGKWLGYWSQVDNKLKKVAVSGGVPVSLCDVTWVVGATWHPDDTIVYSEIFQGVMRVSANGGTPETLVKGFSAFPQLLQDGKSVLFTESSKSSTYGIVVQALETGKRTELFAGVAARYLPTGHLVYALDNNLYAVPFNLDTLEVKGGPVPMVEGVNYFYAVSDSGTLAYIPGAATSAAQSGRALVWVDRKGNEEPLRAPANYYQQPKISPDGTKVTLTATIDNNRDIYIWDLVRETMTRVTFEKENGEAQSIWTPDGKRVVFTALREGGIYWKAADGTGEVETIFSAPDMRFFPWSWSSDGRTLITQETDNSLTKIDIGTLSMEGGHTRKPLLKEDYFETNPNISPDGKYLAYLSTESGQGRIYVRPFPEVNKGKWQISTGYGESPLWSPDGRALFFLGDEGAMEVPVDTKAAFNAGKPRVLFKGPYVGGYGEAPSWDISRDGKRFLMIKQPPPTTPEGSALRKIHIVLNWFEELKGRAPIK
jgi:serine/threonine-protein kinase